MIRLALVAALFAASPAVSSANQSEDPAPEPTAEATPAPTSAPEPTPEPEEPATASPWTWSLNEEGVFRSWEDSAETLNREDRMDGMNRLIGVVTRGTFEVGAQLDIAFANPGDRAGLTVEALIPPPGWTTSLLLTDDTDDGLEYGVVLEKKFMRWSGGPATVELGDTYRALGRGLAIALVKNTELDIDTSLEGAVGELRLAAVEASAFAGWSNPQTISAAFSNQLRRDPRDLIMGGRLAWSGPVELFVHGARYRYDEEAPPQLLVEGDLFTLENGMVGGGGFSLPDFGSGLGDLYVEAVSVTLDGTGLEGAGTHEGWGGYMASNFYLGSVTLTLEGKSYKNLELLNARQGDSANPYDYSTPPTLEKENVVNYNLAKAVNSNDVHGGKLSLSFPVWKGLLGRATYLRLDDLGHRSEEFGGVVDENESIHHGYVGVEKRGEGYFFQVTGGARNETRLEDPDVREVLVHLDGDLLVPLYTGASLEMKGLGYRQTEKSARTGFERTNDVTSFVMSVRPLRWASIAFLVDTTTDERVTSGLGARPGNLSDQAFGAVELTVEPTDKTVARVFAGATQGGLKCSGGTCRVVPAFEGVRVEWLARF